MTQRRLAISATARWRGGAEAWLALASLALVVRCGGANSHLAAHGEGGQGGEHDASGGAPVAVDPTGGAGEAEIAAAGGSAVGDEGGAATNPVVTDGGAGAAGAPSTDSTCAGCRLRSCDGLLTHCQGESCCAESLLPGLDAVNYKATGSKVTLGPVWLDKYEVTVGRFKKFVAGYDAWRNEGNPRVGAGMGAAEHSGWNADWSVNQPPANAAALTTLVDCGPTFSTWHVGDEALPMNCVNWYEAFAFCIWDGGRLPTEVEWQHAASDDTFARTYPWGDAAPDSSRAVYYSTAANPSPLVVGSKPAGAGKWGQMDLAGSVSEWTFDSYAPGFPSASVCDNCTRYAPTDIRVARGGSYFDVNTASLAAADRGVPELSSSARAYVLGFRCARPQ